MKIERIRILDAPLDIVDMRSVLAFIDDQIIGNVKGKYILAMNPEKVFALKRNPSMKELFEQASILLPDGIGVVRAVRLLYGKRITRVPGVNLMLNICNVSAVKGYRIFVYGAQEEVNKKAVERLCTIYPGTKIVGRCNGYLNDYEIDTLVEEINNTGANILFVALGSPKQEKWIKRYLPKLNVNICQGIGGTLDTIAGNVKRAPLFMQRLGLEWFYRLIREPRRIRRQIVLPMFALEVMKKRVTLK